MSHQPPTAPVRDFSPVGEAGHEPDRSIWSTITDIRTFQALKYRNFRYLWLSQISNSASLWMEQIAKPLLVIDMVSASGGDNSLAALHIGGILAARTFPQFGFGLAAGVMADWYDRRMLILVSKFLNTIVNFLFAFLLLSGFMELWHVYVATVLRGVFTSFDNPARQAVLPSLVPLEDLANAVALNSASMQTMRIGAAALAGLSIVVIGMEGTFLAVAIFSALAVALTYLMRVPPMPEVKDKSLRSAFSSLWDGLVFAWQTPTVRGVLLLTFAFFCLASAYTQVFAPLFAKQTNILNIGDQGYGFLVSAAGIGALIGALTVATLIPNRGRGRLMLFLMLTLGGLLIAFGLSTYLPALMGTPGLELPMSVVLPWSAAAFGVILFLGAVQTSYLALTSTVLLEVTPDDKRGRIMGVLALDRSMITLGGMVAGFLSAVIGPQLAQILFGVAVIGFALSLSTLLPSLRKIE